MKKEILENIKLTEIKPYERNARKNDQQTGNPKGFYESLGYKSVIDSMVGKKSNIELMTK